MTRACACVLLYCSALLHKLVLRFHTTLPCSLSCCLHALPLITSLAPPQPGAALHTQIPHVSQRLCAKKEPGCVAPLPATPCMLWPGPLFPALQIFQAQRPLGSAATHASCLPQTCLEHAGDAKHRHEPADDVSVALAALLGAEGVAAVAPTHQAASEEREVLITCVCCKGRCDMHEGSNNMAAKNAD